MGHDEYVQHSRALARDGAASMVARQDPEDASMSSSPFPACSVHSSLRRELQHDALLAVQSAGGLAELEHALVRDECQQQDPEARNGLTSPTAVSMRCTRARGARPAAR